MTIDIGLIGCGGWGRLILRDLVSLDARVHVVAPSAATRAFATGNGAVSAVADIAGIRTPIAGYVVATPTTTHGSVIQTLLPTGRPVFVEKPFTNDVGLARG